MTNYLAEIRIFAGGTAPENWLFCDGSLVSVSLYNELFSVLGTTYGGDGKVTFGLPDMRGRLLVQNGILQDGGTYPFATPGGEETVLLATADLPEHTHSVTACASPGTTSLPLGNFLAAPVDGGNDDSTVLAYMPGNASDATLKTVALNELTIGLSGLPNASHENRQPYLVINYMIAATGTYTPDA